MSEWMIYDPNAAARTKKTKLPDPPPWRRPGKERENVMAATFLARADVVEAVNAALLLRRPLLITGKPGTGKSSLIYSVAAKLALGKVLVWSINSRSTLREGLYQYDALARLQHLQEVQTRSAQTASRTQRVKRVNSDTEQRGSDLDLFLTLGPLGAALASKRAPRALLIDEIDKSDIDLPNDLLDVLDRGRFVIPELSRIAKEYSDIDICAPDDEVVPVHNGEIEFAEFPFIVMTSNGERDFPAPFLRRCVQCHIPEPDEADLARIVAAHFPGHSAKVADLICKFVRRRSEIPLATDQVMNAVHLLGRDDQFSDADEEKLLRTLFQPLG